MEYDKEYIKRLMLFMAEQISKSASTIGFEESDTDIVLLRGSRSDVLKEMAKVFTDIEFLGGGMVSICEMPVLKGKFYLNCIAALLSGRHGAVGPLSFTLSETTACRLSDGREAKIIKINEGAVDLLELRNLFESFPAIRIQTVKTERVIAIERYFAQAAPVYPINMESGI